MCVFLDRCLRSSLAPVIRQSIKDHHLIILLGITSFFTNEFIFININQIIRVLSLIQATNTFTLANLIFTADLNLNFIAAILDVIGSVATICCLLSI